MKTATLFKWKERFVYFFILAGILLFLSSCSSESYTQQKEEIQKGEQTLTFTEEENGKDVHYEVNFKDGKIISIYKDNVKIPEGEIENYEDLVDDRVSSLRDDDFYFYHPKPHVFHFDMKEFKENMKEWKENFKADQFKFEFDKEKFNADMEKLKEELKDMDEIVIKIDKDKIKKGLDKLKLYKFDFDVDELNENMKRITIEIEKNKENFELNLEDLEEEMNQLDEEMEDLSIEMEELNKEMKILSSFLDDVKSELVKDGLIKDPDEDFELELTKDYMEVNGEKVPDSLHSKYKGIYKKHYNKEPKEKIIFNIK